MNAYERFVLCWDANDLEGGAKIIHQFIDEQTFQGVHLPIEILSSIEDVLKIRRERESTVPIPEEFAAICNAIHRSMVEGRGNPTVNN